jgi:hypothetical protein
VTLTVSRAADLEKARQVALTAAASILAPAGTDHKAKAHYVELEAGRAVLLVKLPLDEAQDPAEAVSRFLIAVNEAFAREGIEPI